MMPGEAGRPAFMAAVAGKQLGGGLRGWRPQKPTLRYGGREAGIQLCRWWLV